MNILSREIRLSARTYLIYTAVVVLGAASTFVVGHSWFGALGIVGLVIWLPYSIVMLLDWWVWRGAPRPSKAPAAPEGTSAPSEAPVTPVRKQLRVLIAMAIWVAAALFLALDASSDRYGTFRLGSFVAASVAFSAPALLFGGIWLWWLRQR